MRFDKTGPEGKGPGTGRGLGNCSGEKNLQNMRNSERGIMAVEGVESENDLPRPGFEGFGRAMGGRGFGRGGRRGRRGQGGHGESRGFGGPGGQGRGGRW